MPRSPLATPTASLPSQAAAAATEEVRPQTPGKRHSQVAAWVAETQRVMNADWINRVSHGYGLNEETATASSSLSLPPSRHRERPAITGTLFQRSLSSRSDVVDSKPIPLTRKQLSAGNIPQKPMMTGKSISRDVPVSSNKLDDVSYRPSGDNNDNRHIEEDDEDDDDDEEDENQLQSLLSSVRDEDVLQLSRMTRGHAEQRRANGMNAGSGMDPPAISYSLHEDSSNHGGVRRSRPVSPYATLSADSRTQELQVSDATLDRSERCKADLNGRYANMYAQMADHNNYNPLSRIREQQKQQQKQQQERLQMHTRAASWTGSPRSDRFPDSARPISPKLPIQSHATNRGYRQMDHLTPPIEAVEHATDTNIPFALSHHNSTVKYQGVDFNRENPNAVHNDDDDADDADDVRSVTSDSHLIRRGRTIAREIKHVLTHARLKNPLRKAITRKNDFSGNDVESGTEHASNATTSNVDSASEGDLPMATPQELVHNNQQQSLNKRNTIAHFQQGVKPWISESTDQHDITSSKSLTDPQDIVESSLTQVARKALSDRQMSSYPRLQFVPADRRLSWNQALEAAVDASAMPVNTKSLNDPEEFRKAVMSDRVSRLFARFYEREAHDNYFRMRRLITVQDTLVELDITLLEAQRKIFGEFSELVKQLQSDMDETRETRKHYLDDYNQDIESIKQYQNTKGISSSNSNNTLDGSMSYNYLLPASIATLIDQLNSRHADIYEQLHEVSDCQKRLTSHTRDTMSRTNSLSQTSSLCFQQLNILIDEHQRFVTSYHSYWMDVFYSFISYVLAGTAYGFWLIALFIIYIRRILLLPRNLLTPSTRRRSDPT
ncbi:hypothetical protein BDF22DRAFT_667753 [Syncephalis plumigaleata]|nr:hypothetical protein BDF22DRAFT_667753 [Syncephalis plumigaleata]